jgi:hypothetical protein
MGGKAFDVILAIVWVALIFVLVRPGSQGPGFVTAVSNGLKGLLGTATGGGTWSGK